MIKSPKKINKIFKNQKLKFKIKIKKILKVNKYNKKNNHNKQMKKTKLINICQKKCNKIQS